MGWQDWGWRRWRRCWRRPSRRKPDWWRVEWVPLNFNCLWNIIYPSPCLSYKRDRFHEFKKEAPGPFGITALKIVSYLQRVIDMKGWILTSSQTVILTQTISCWIIFSCIPSHSALCILCICMYFSLSPNKSSHSRLEAPLCLNLSVCLFCQEREVQARKQLLEAERRRREEVERRLLDETAHRQRLVEEEVKMREKQCSQVSTSGKYLNKLVSDQR